MLRQFGTSHVVCIIACLGLGACQHATPPPSSLPANPLSKRPEVQIRSFSETVPFVAVAEMGAHLFAGTPAGIVRFNRAGTSHTLLKRPDGASLSGVTALSSDNDGSLFIANTGGVTQYREGGFRDLPQPALKRVHALVATKDTVWAGGVGGLARFRQGKWAHYLPGATAPIVVKNKDGSGVWVGTSGEGLYSVSSTAIRSHGVQAGQRVRHVTNVALAADGGVFVTGRDDLRQDWLCYYDGTAWAAYRVADAIDWIARVGKLVLMHNGGRVSQLVRLDPALTIPQLPEGAIHLVPIVAPERSDERPSPHWYQVPTGAQLPAKPAVVHNAGDHILFGTRAVGAARYDGQTLRWYRTGELAAGEASLKAACGERSCYLAMGGRAFRYDGNHFLPTSVGPDATIYTQAFVQSRSGTIEAIHSPVGESALVVSQLGKSGFARKMAIKVAVPNGQPFVRFAKYDPKDRLWVGLEYVDAGRERRPWGVVVVGQDGRATFHRSTLLPKEVRSKGSLALPDDIRGVFFDSDVVWMATGAGVCRVQGREVKLFTENDGLESEIVYQVAKATDGEVIAATFRGLGRFSAGVWNFDFPKMVSGRARALVPWDDVVWVGTSYGLVRLVKPWSTGAYSFGLRDGLAGDEVVGLFAARAGQLWVLTTAGLSIVEF